MRTLVFFSVSSISYRPTDLSLLKEFSKNVSFSNIYILPSESVVQKISMSTGTLTWIIWYNDCHQKIIKADLSLCRIVIYTFQLICSLFNISPPIKKNFSLISGFLQRRFQNLKNKWIQKFLQIHQGSTVNQLFSPEATMHSFCPWKYEKKTSNGW